jgi:hypothetical protein
MTASPLYIYHLSGRRRGTIFALGVGMAMLALGISHAAPWYFLAPVALSLAMALWLIIANPQSGSVLNTETLYFFYRNKKETLRIADIASMKVTDWSDGPDTVAITLKSGDIVHVPSMCADSKLAVALRGLKIAEIGRG